MTREGSIYEVCGTFCRLLWVAINRGVVPGAGIEPARYFYRGILSPLCLPISPPGLSVYVIYKDANGIVSH
jgi:predicted membrane protein